MSGHGGFSGIRGGAGSTKIPLKDGGYIDLKDMPLKYGKYDQNIDKKTREQLDKFEKTHRDDKYNEHGLLLDKDGKVVEKAVGKSGEVEMKKSSYDKSTTMSHSHNSDNTGLLGGTFSVADADTFTGAKGLKTMRAAAKEGTYSITKRKGFEGKKFKEFIRKEREKSWSQYLDKKSQLKKDYESGKIKKVDYYIQKTKALNAHAVRMHNTYLGGQDKYGYDYTLERRRK